MFIESLNIPSTMIAKMHACMRDYFDCIRELTYWKIQGEPQHFRTFVDELVSGKSHEFVQHMTLNHISSQSSHLNFWFDLNFTHIAKFEYMNENIQIIKNKCPKTFEYLKNKTLLHALKGAGASLEKPSPIEYAKLLSLPYTDEMTIENKFKNKPAVKAINQEYLNKIVEFFYQDYICFGYLPIYPEIGLKYTGSYDFTVLDSHWNSKFN